MEREIDSLNNHTIVFGYGQTGNEIVEALKKYGHNFLVVDNDPDKVWQAQKQGIIAYLGDATAPTVLEACKIHNAKAIAAALPTDEANISLVKMVRSFNSKANIIARVINEAATQEILKAGANRVVSMYQLSGKRMANLLSRPGMLEFIDSIVFGGSTDLVIEEVALHENSPLIGKTLSSSNFRNLTGGAMVLGIRRAGKKMTINPPSYTQLYEDSVLLVLATSEQADKLLKIAQPNTNGTKEQ